MGRERKGRKRYVIRKPERKKRKIRKQNNNMKKKGIGKKDGR